MCSLCWLVFRVLLASSGLLCLASQGAPRQPQQACSCVGRYPCDGPVQAVEKSEASVTLHLGSLVVVAVKFSFLAQMLEKYNIKCYKGRNPVS